MTHKVNDVVVLVATEPAECSDCGKEEELRPYGPDGTWVCFDCGMKDEEGMVEQFGKLFDGGRDI